MATKTVKACYSGFSEITTRPLLQYDYGQTLLITGMELPQAYEVIFSNTKNGAGKSQIGDEDGVSIPDEYLTTGLPVYAKLFLHEGQEDGEGVLTITIPVTKSTYDSTDPPTPVEQSAITQAIAALNEAVEETGENVTLSARYAEESEESAEDSEAWAVGKRSGVDVQPGDDTYQNNSKYYAQQAKQSEQNAKASEDNAKQSEDNAKTSEDNAKTSEDNAEGYMQRAETAAENAEQSAATAGYMFFYIDENGDLIYQRTPSTQVDFYLHDGDLYVRSAV